MIDAHQHFWKLSRGDYAWLNETVAPILRDFAPYDLAPLLAKACVTQTILVQATDTVAETEWLLDVAARSSFVAGVVGWVDLASTDAIATIDRLRQNPALKGLRPMLQDISETDWILRADVQPALAHMAKVGLPFDALIQPRHLGALLSISGMHPELRIVIDHIAKPRMTREGPDADWIAGMNALAARPNLYCKFSGMITEWGQDWSADGLAPFVEVVLRAFGPDRIMWGSDWPVLNLAGDYESWITAARGLTADLTEAERAMVFGGTARSFYQLQT